MLAQADRANRYPAAAHARRGYQAASAPSDCEPIILIDTTACAQKDGRSAVEMRPIPQHRAVLPANRYHSA
jgi:hypothetical protein